ncbi:MAG TPA: hypothetical protein VNV43_02610 [Candidatus Acidoferrales bacterium]|jgi:hypothetical protein|nr:hypothetical protein [Candidatus Acidoferrales bacterium]
MRERPEQIAKLVCLALGTLLFLRFVWIILTANPLARVAVPELPSLPDDSPAASQGATPAIVMNSTNRNAQIPDAVKTNLSAAVTNSIQRSGAVVEKAGPARQIPPAPVASNADSLVALSDAGTHPNHSPHRRRGPMAAGAMGFPGGKPAVAPAIQASIDRITDSEILGPVVRPLPMALLGIAGKVAFLRTPDGVTGLVKEGDELGGIKLLRIGINRALIEENGQQKELTIFDGIGGETLLDKSPQSSNENHNPQH